MTFSPNVSICTHSYLGLFALSFCLCYHIVDRSHIKECGLRILIHFSVDDHLEAADRLLERHIFARDSGECLSYEERLGQESLDLSGTHYCRLILIGQLLHTED